MSTPRKLNVLVYSGTGTTAHSVSQCVTTLRRLLYPNYAVIQIRETALATEPWEATCALLVIPGGADLGYCRVLNGATNRRIVQYVRAGGHFLGLCAGGYYGSGVCEFEVGNGALEVVGRRELVFFPGICRGGAYSGFSYQSEQGARAVSLTVHTAAFGADLAADLPTEACCYYNGGGVFVDATAAANVQVLASYPDNLNVDGGDGRAAAVFCTIGAGAALLTGPHPEFEAAALHNQPSVPHYRELLEALRRDDAVQARVRFLRACLTKLGLTVGSGSAVPMHTTALHLVSAHPDEVQELMMKLESEGMLRVEQQESDDMASDEPENPARAGWEYSRSQSLGRPRSVEEQDEGYSVLQGGDDPADTIRVLRPDHDSFGSVTTGLVINILDRAMRDRKLAGVIADLTPDKVFIPNAEMALMRRPERDATHRAEAAGPSASGAEMFDQVLKDATAAMTVESDAGFPSDTERTVPPRAVFLRFVQTLIAVLRGKQIEPSQLQRQIDLLTAVWAALGDDSLNEPFKAIRLEPEPRTLPIRMASNKMDAEEEEEEDGKEYRKEDAKEDAKDTKGDAKGDAKKDAEDTKDTKKDGNGPDKATPAEGTSGSPAQDRLWVVVYERSWPRRVNLFDFGIYFQALAQYRKTAPRLPASDSYSWGDILMYGRVVSSTNTLLETNTRLTANVPTGFTLTATTQVQARGRGGNVWLAPDGQLILSTVIHHPVRFKDGRSRPVVFLQYLAAIAIVEAIEAYAPGYERLGVRLKWPNDVYVLDEPGASGRGTATYSRYTSFATATSTAPPKATKIGGILAQCSFSDDQYHVVLGIGLNAVNARPTTSLDALLSPALRAAAPVVPERLLACLLTRLEAVYAQFLGNGFDRDLEARYYRHWLHTGQLVRLDAVPGHPRARVVGITTDWGLLRVAEVADDGPGMPARETGRAWTLQSDENSFDYWKGLLRTKT